MNSGFFLMELNAMVPQQASICSILFQRKKLQLEASCTQWIKLNFAASVGTECSVCWNIGTYITCGTTMGYSKIVVLIVPTIILCHHLFTGNTHISSSFQELCLQSPQIQSARSVACLLNVILIDIQLLRHTAYQYKRLICSPYKESKIIK